MEFIKNYTETFPLYRHDCDFLGRALPGAILRGAQQIATDHCNCFGMTDELYAKTHTAFLLAKIAVEFEKIPRQDQTLTFFTHPEGMRRAVFKRITRVTDEGGELCAFVDSRWILVDTDSRKILRQAPPEMQFAWSETVEGELDHKIVRPRQLEACGEHGAAYTLCDTNGHLNNTRYADIVCNALPTELLREHPVRSMKIHYHREIPLGQTFSLWRGQTGENGWYFTGRQEETSCFEAAVELF